MENAWKNDGVEIGENFFHWLGVFRRRSSCELRDITGRYRRSNSTRLDVLPIIRCPISNSMQMSAQRGRTEIAQLADWLSYNG